MPEPVGHQATGHAGLCIADGKAASSNLCSTHLACSAQGSKSARLMFCARCFVLTCSATQAASYAQRALEAKSAEELEEAALRSARAQSQAEEAEARAATAAAMATAHQEVSASQAVAAEQACFLLMALLGPDRAIRH